MLPAMDRLRFEQRLSLSVSRTAIVPCWCALLLEITSASLPLFNASLSGDQLLTHPGHFA